MILGDISVFKNITVSPVLMKRWANIQVDSD